MVEVVRATKQQPLGLVDKKLLGQLLPYGLPLLMALACIISLMLTINQASVLRTWSGTFSGSGVFLTEACDPLERRGADQWQCRGRLTAGDVVVREPTLVTSMGALASDRPYVGENIDVFFNREDADMVYPVQYRLNELTRLYLSLLPRLLVFIGSVIWLAGWFLTRNLDVEDYVARDAVRLPQRFNWRSRGFTWIGAAVVITALNYLLATRVIGSLDII